MRAIDRLLVIWGEPSAGNRQVIGHLARVGGELRFWYERDLSDAISRGFRLLPEFPEHRVEAEPYVERYLFPLFAERIPALTRHDAKAMMRAWGVEHPDDQFEVLAKSGGIRATDRLELAEYRADDDDLTDSLEFRIAGRRYIPADDLAPLEVGCSVSLRPDPTNPKDPQAVIVDRYGKRAGYAPRQYTTLFGRLLKAGARLEGEAVRQLLVPDDVGKWVVRVSRARS